MRLRRRGDTDVSTLRQEHRKDLNHRDRGFVILTFSFHKEGQYWVGICEELGTAADGRSLDKVADRLRKLVALQLNGLGDLGERERLFKERGITLYASDLPAKVQRSVPVSQDCLSLVQTISIPIDEADVVSA
jgi:predicted RNase H-like HicB family nuclease